MRLVRRLTLALVIAAPFGAPASDAPHNSSQIGDGSGINCVSCHIAHSSTGKSLTSWADNYSLCISCHQNASRTGVQQASFNPAAVGSTTGLSHSYSASATNSTIGATPPSATSTDPGEQAMAARLVNGNLQCSTCHNQHSANAYQGTQWVSAITSAVTGTGTLSYTATSTASAKGYRIQILSTTSLFKVSNDGGTSWWGCSPTATSFPPTQQLQPADYPPSATNYGCSIGSNRALEASSNVLVTLPSSSASYKVGDHWDFYVSYPFLRASSTDGHICTICHKNRNQSSRNVEGYDPIVGTSAAITFGTTVFSHPVNEALSHSYDRTQGTNGPVLDADGSTNDGKRTNDLAFGTGGIVSCMTCHHPHNADSNSLTEDGR